MGTEQRTYFSFLRSITKVIIDKLQCITIKSISVSSPKKASKSSKSESPHPQETTWENSDGQNFTNKKLKLLSPVATKGAEWKYGSCN